MATKPPTRFASNRDGLTLTFQKAYCNCSCGSSSHVQTVEASSFPKNRLVWAAGFDLISHFGPCQKNNGSWCNGDFCFKCPSNGDRMFQSSGHDFLLFFFQSVYVYELYTYNTMYYIKSNASSIQQFDDSALGQNPCAWWTEEWLENSCWRWSLSWCSIGYKPWQFFFSFGLCRFTTAPAGMER